MLLPTLLHPHFRGVPPSLADPIKSKRPLFQGFGLVQSHFTYIANGQFPPPYPLKHSFSLPSILPSKNRNLSVLFSHFVRPICPSISPSYRPNTPNQDTSTPPHSNAIQPSFKRRSHKAHISPHTALKPNKQRELPLWHKKGRRRKPTALRRKPHVSPCAHLYPQK